VFLNWANHMLKHVAEQAPLKDLKELSNGLGLINLLEVCSHKTLFGVQRRARLRLQHLNNAKIALDFLHAEGIELANCSPERRPSPLFRFTCERFTPHRLVASC
jgi:hypothetical protein